MIKSSQKQYEEKLKSMDAMRTDLEKKIHDQTQSQLQGIEALRQQFKDKEVQNFQKKLCSLLVMMLFTGANDRFVWKRNC
jgi:hypothetical protein